MSDFTDKELEQFLDIDEDFTPDISEKEAYEEVQRAARQVDFNKKRDQFNQLIHRYQKEPVKLWRLAYRWLMYSNADAREDIKIIIEECRQLRETRANRFAMSKDSGFRYGMRIPRIVMETLSLIDPRIQEIETQDPASAKKLYRQLEREFPEFRIPKQN